MGKYIAKFEAASTPRIDDVLKIFKISIKDLEEMIENLKKYGMNNSLLNDLETSKRRDWRDLRGWKVENYLNRWKDIQVKIEEAELVEDYFLELTDKGYRIKINLTTRRVNVYTKGVSGTRLIHFYDVINYLYHLNNMKRLSIELVSVMDNNEFLIKYSIPGEPEEQIYS